MVTDFIFLGCKATVDSDCSHEIERCLLFGRKAMTNLDSWSKCRSITLPTNTHIVKAMVFLVVMYRCEIWTKKNSECQRIDGAGIWIVVLEKTLESPLDYRKIKPVHPKGNQPWIFFRGTDAEAPILWPPDVKRRLIGENPDAGKDWRQEMKGRQRMRWWEGNDRGLDGWIVSPARWIWVWASSGG